MYTPLSTSSTFYRISGAANEDIYLPSVQPIGWGWIYSYRLYLCTLPMNVHGTSKMRVSMHACGDWLISLGLERVSRSRIWEGLYIERERPHVHMERISRINLFKYCISEALIHMDSKVVNNFVVRVLAPPRIPSQQLTLIRYRGLYLMHMQKYHTWLHKFPSPPFNMHNL